MYNYQSVVIINNISELRKFLAVVFSMYRKSYVVFKMFWSPLSNMVVFILMVRMKVFFRDFEVEAFSSPPNLELPHSRKVKGTTQKLSLTWSQFETKRNQKLNHIGKHDNQNREVI